MASNEYNNTLFFLITLIISASCQSPNDKGTCLLHSGDTNVCQVMVPQHQALPLPNATRNGTCQPPWMPISPTTNLTSNPGGFFALDGTGSCHIPSQLPCLPGFYCEGGNRTPAKACPKGTTCLPERNLTDSIQPVPCPAGNFCPIPTYEPITCPGGSYCPQYTSIPTPCPGGHYCPTPATQSECPEGHYCTLGSSEPRPCFIFAGCGVGTSKQDLRLFSGGFLVAQALVLVAFAKLPTDWAFLLVAPMVGGGLFVIWPAAGICLWVFTVITFVTWKIWPLLVRKPTTSIEGAYELHKEDESKEGGEATTTTTNRGLSFQIRGLYFYLGTEIKPEKCLMHDVNVDIEAGKLTAIMGPSGCGKTTLMTLVKGTAFYGTRTGDFHINHNTKLTPADIQKVMGFVPQDDVMHRELTVTDNISYQARLRLPRGVDGEEVNAHVITVLEQLDLTHRKDEAIGTEGKRGISGGQRKRVSIGMELVTRPSVLLLDEPTSGLDSTSSYKVISCLKDACRTADCTVVAVIHQPRWDVLTLFDQLILLAPKGKLVYAGPTVDAVDYFRETLNAKFDQGNPADVFLDVITAAYTEGFEGPDPSELWKGHKSTLGGGSTISTLQASSEEGLYDRATAWSILATGIHFQRAFHQIQVRSLGVAIHLGLLGGAVLLLTLTYVADDLSKTITQLGMAQLICSLLQGVAAQRTFGGDERYVWWRESSTGVSALPYFIGKDIAAHVEIFFSSLVFTFIYGPWSGGLVYYGSIFAATFALTSVVYAVNYVFSLLLNPAAAQMCAVVSAFLTFLVAGISPSYASLNESVFGHLMLTISPIRWAFAFLLTRQVRSETAIIRTAGTGVLTFMGYPMTDDALPDLDADGGWAATTLPLWILALCFRLIAALVLVVGGTARQKGTAYFIPSFLRK